MSDLAAKHINIHDGTVEGVMRELCNMFVRRSVRPNVTDLMKRYRAIKSTLPDIQRKMGSRSLYEARIFSNFGMPPLWSPEEVPEWIASDNRADQRHR